MDLFVLEDNNYDEFVKNSKVPVFIDLWAEWCKPCIKAQPTLMDLADEYAGRMAFCKVDVEKNSVLERRFDIRKIPRYVIVDSNDSVLEDFVEAQPKKTYIEYIESALKKNENK